MILLTVGTQLPFDRLIEAVDLLAPDLSEPVIAQVGKGSYVCKNMENYQDVTPSKFEVYLSSCSRIIAHSGIGTVLNAQKFNKPLILVPRVARYGEHRNDHQLATCRMLTGKPGIHIAEDPAELTVEFIEQAITPLTSGQDNVNLSKIRAFLKDTVSEWARG